MDENTPVESRARSRWPGCLAAAGLLAWIICLARLALTHAEETGDPKAFLVRSLIPSFFALVLVEAIWFSRSHNVSWGLALRTSLFANTASLAALPLFMVFPVGPILFAGLSVLIEGRLWSELAHLQRTRRFHLEAFGVGFFRTCLCGIVLSVWADYMVSEPERRYEAMCDMRTMATALESYYLDHSSYPPCTRNTTETQGHTPHWKGGVFTLRGRSEDYQGATLTTPIAYMDALLADRFQHPKGNTFGYYRPPDSTGYVGYVLFSPGPDRKFDMQGPEYDASVAQPSDLLLARYAYDPTNGAGSSGDIFRVKQ